MSFSHAVSRTCLAFALLSAPTAVIAQAGQNVPSVEQRNSIEANEPLDMRAPAEQDAAALERARSGWWAEALKTKDERLAWWRDARFGAFVHWGPYSVLGGDWHGQPPPTYAEHIMRVQRIPLAVYRDEVAGRFHPDAFDATNWVRMMKDAGMRYLIITAKHHDGFAMWPSDASDFDIADVGHFERDPLSELVAAARAEGLHVGFYYSHAFDWENPDAPGNDWDYNNPGGDRLLGGKDWWNTNPAFLQNTQRYIDTKVIPQLQELISRYHPDILWFDTPEKLPFFQQAEIVEAVRRAAPDVVINGRAARSPAANLGDYLNSGDRAAEFRPIASDWESIPTTNESYGYSSQDQSYKPPSHFIQLIARAAAKGGNILLNVGPMGDGAIAAPDRAIFHDIGQWMHVYGDSIYGTSRTPLDRQSWGDSTVKGDNLFLHVFAWPPNGSLTLGGLTSRPRAAYLLGDPLKTPIPFVTLANGDIELTTPLQAPNAIDSVIVMETAGPPTGTTGRLIETGWGHTQLLAFDAKTTGGPFVYGDGKKARYYVEGLQLPNTSLTWPIRATQSRKMKVVLSYNTAAATQPGDAVFHLTYGGRTWTTPVVPTATDTTVQTIEIGLIDIQSGDLEPLTLTVTGGDATPVRVFELNVEPAS